MAQIDAGFESGNIERVRKKGQNYFCCHARKDTSPNPLWFYFRMKGVRGRNITIELENASDVKNEKCHLENPNNWEVVRPVYSYDKKAWRRIKNRCYSQEKGAFIFSQIFSKDTVFIAFCFPYTYGDLKKYLARIKKSSFTEISSFGKTRGGRNLSLVTITNSSFKKSKIGVWILARQHAGETPGSYALEGLVDYVLSDRKMASELREKVIFNIVPMVDIDNVCRGAYGKNSLPVDFSDDWGEKSIRPEVIQIKNLIRKWCGSNSFDLFMDFHAPVLSHGNHFYDNPSRSQCSSDYFKRQSYFMELLERYSPPNNPYVRGKEMEFGTGESDKARAYLRRTYGVLGFTIEMSYHRALRGTDIYSTPSSLRAYGASIARVIYHFFKKYYAE